MTEYFSQIVLGKNNGVPTPKARISFNSLGITSYSKKSRKKFPAKSQWYIQINVTNIAFELCHRHWEAQHDTNLGLGICWNYITTVFHGDGHVNCLAIFTGKNSYEGKNAKYYFKMGCQLLVSCLEFDIYCPQLQYWGVSRKMF